MYAIRSYYGAVPCGSWGIVASLGAHLGPGILQHCLSGAEAGEYLHLALPTIAQFDLAQLGALGGHHIDGGQLRLLQDGALGQTQGLALA